jgi:HAD superfamily hydrolase (TIGR01549 family)
MPVKAILFDLGGTLWDDYPMELEHWRFMAAELQSAGLAVSVQDFIDQVPVVIDSYCPSLTRGLLFSLLGGQHELLEPLLARLAIHMEVLLGDRDSFRRHNVLHGDCVETLELLAGRYRLAVVSQHSGAMRQWLAHYNLQGYFENITLTGERLSKPDPHLFAACLDALGVAPADAVMVGDRLDNDIWPANYLGMQTVRIAAQPYSIQRPRYPLDVPDAEIARLGELVGAI